MKTWLTSLNGALTLSAIALITEAWRSFLDAMFVLPTDIGDEGLLNLANSLNLIFGLLAAIPLGSQLRPGVPRKVKMS